MTPHEFLRKWRNVELKERTASQSHFNDLCALLSVLDPIAADPTGDWFTFEKGVEKTTGGDGWADVWRKDCFAWEYKGPGKDLDKALQQLLRYSRNLDNPPLLIVSDMDRIRVHTNFTNSVAEMQEFALEELGDGEVRERLKHVFTDPDFFRPAKTRQMLTEEVAREFATLAQRLRDRGHEATAVAHFVVRCAFCMFAQSVELLPNAIFTRLVEESRRKPEDFAELASDLFRLMSSGGRLGLERVAWFNGGLFEDDAALPLNNVDLDLLIAACKQNWAEVDPSILGTLFERGLDPDKRSQLGAHYTDRAKIEMILEPTIAEPVTTEWTTLLGQASAAVEAAEMFAELVRARAATHGELKAEVRALEGAMSRGGQAELFPDAPRQKMVRELDALAREVRAATAGVRAARDEVRRTRDAFMARLRAFRVLDPACGSGNFLYVALKLLKDIEHRVNVDAEALGVPLVTPEVGPSNVLGIELNPFAAELARTSVWIGDIQWMRKNGFEPSRDPVLKSLDTIECRDAVLAEDGTRAEWPAADVVVGNPPFLGNKKMIRELGEDYTRALRKAWPEVPGGVDLVCYWFAKAWAMIAAGKLTRAGLVTTNSIRGGANREVLKPVVEHGRIFNAWSDEGWTVEGAAVRVSLICFDQESAGAASLNGRSVEKVLTDLSAFENNVDLTAAAPISTNLGLTFQGAKFGGPFGITGQAARRLLTTKGNPNGRPNSDVVKRWTTGLDLTRRIEERWCLDFGNCDTKEKAALYEKPFELFEFQWTAENFRRANSQPPLPELRSNEAETLATPWLHQRPRPERRAGLLGFNRFIATPEVAKHRVFIWLPKYTDPSGSIYSIARDDDTSFGILHSRFHELWSLRMGTSLEDRPRYTPSTTFETFPFPEGLTPDIPAAAYADDPRAQAIAAAAEHLNELRENWLNPADLVVRVPEVVPGYPDRILPKDDEAAKELKKRTLTNLYNTRPQWLVNAHAVLDQAVADAYEWGDDWRAGVLTDEEILARLFKLNQERSASAAGTRSRSTSFGTEQGRDGMADDKSKRGAADRSTVASGEGYEVNYFAKKHDISKKQAEDLIARVGNDRERLNAAASQLKKR